MIFIACLFNPLLLYHFTKETTSFFRILKYTLYLAYILAKEKKKNR